MFWTIVTILLALWMLALIANVGGSLIHLLLVAALALSIMRLLTNRQSTV